MSTLGERIKLARGTDSQEAFSRILGISKGSLGVYERNENLPNTDVILKICSKTGVRLEWLLTGAGPMCPQESCTPGMEEARGQAGPAEAPERPGAAAEKCPYCARLENRLEIRLDRLEEERRELSSENRRLWKENAELRERCAHYEERKRQRAMPLTGGKAGCVSR